MQRVVKAILKRETALLESPTGTGKTQALLSSCLAAQRHLMLQGQKVGKIIYATRTIGQVKQLPGELRRNPYRALAAPLASRAHYCTNDAVKAREGDNARLSQACRKMAKAVEKFRGGGGDVIWDDQNPHHERQQTVGCPHYRALASPQTATTLHATRPGCCASSSNDIEDLAGVVNMDDLRRLARGDEPGHEGACAYHSATALAKRSHIIFCPYQYLMNPSIRQAMGIENYLEDAIAIVDEAHNVESVARDGGSFDKSLFDLAQLEDYCTRRQSVRGNSVSALGDVVRRLRTGLLAAQEVWCGPARDDHDEDDDKKTRYPCDVSMAKRQRFRVSPDERDVVPGFDWGAADRRPTTVGFFEKFQLSPDLLNRAAGEASVVAEEARNADGDEFIIGDQLEGLAGCLLLAYQQRTHYAICCRAWPNQSCERPKRFRDSLHSQDLQRLSGTEPAWGFELCVWLLHPGVVLDDLAKKVRCLVLASGTLAPLDQTERELGIEFSRRMATKALEAKHVVCTKRQVLVRAVGSAAFESRPPVQLMGNAANLKKDEYRLALGAAVVKLVQRCPGGALVFLPSYKVLSSLRWTWRDDRLHLRYGAERQGREVNTILRRLERAKGTVLFEGKGDGGGEATHEETIADYKRAVARRGSALLFCVYRGKCSEGISYNDDACRLVVTVGIPYAPAFDHLVMRKRAYNDAKIKGGLALGMAPGACDRGVMSGQAWYATQAFRALNQALGRSARPRGN
jgi:Fanconi anemia group J protein